MNRIVGILAVLLCGLLFGCAQKTPQDYSAFRQCNPKSILVLPPANHSPDVKASHSLLSHVTFPLAESGYYVFPVVVVEEMFLHNGLTTPEEIHAVNVEKLAQIFKADAVLYLDIKEYGTQYQVIASDTRVTAEARLVSLKNGQVLWHDSATASSNEQRNASVNNGLVGILTQALVEQIANTVTEQGHKIAGITSNRLLSAGHTNGILYGPRSPKYNQEPQP
jgi:hypothetical protein